MLVSKQYLYVSVVYIENYKDIFFKLGLLISNNSTSNKLHNSVKYMLRMSKHRYCFTYIMYISYIGSSSEQKLWNQKSRPRGRYNI